MTALHVCDTVITFPAQDILSQLPIMSDLPHARSSITQAFDKAAVLKGDEARQEIIEIFKRVAARCDDWLAGNDEILTDDAAPDMSGVQYANYYRNVNMATNSPAHFPKLERLTEVYTAEKNLLDNTQRALMEHHLRFDNDPDDPGYFSVTEQAKAMQAMAAKVQGYVTALPDRWLTC